MKDKEVLRFLYISRRKVNTAMPEKLKGLYTTIALALLICGTTQAQYFGAKSGYWKNERHSMSVGLGASNFLGELGGRDQIGSDFIWDLELSKTQPSLMVNYRYQFGSALFARAQFSFGYIAGNDALTEETFRRNRNIHFRAPIFELAGMVEAELLNFRSKSRYGLGGKTSIWEGFSLFAVVGVGVTRFNPQANFDGTWYDLRPLSTEGQGLEGGPEEYSLFTTVIPMGIRIAYEINKEWTLGLEVMHRITFTDYMDDVSGVYYNNEVIRDDVGDLAAYFADPSLGTYIDENGNELPLNSTDTGQQRGNPENNDSYMFAHFTATYKFSQKRFKRSRGRVTKRRTRRVVF